MARPAPARGAHPADHVGDPCLRHHLRADRGGSRYGDYDADLEDVPDHLPEPRFRSGQRLRLHGELHHLRPGHRLFPRSLSPRRVRVVIGRSTTSGGWANRERRRKILLTLAGGLVALYVLAPFSWLLLTSFMHERDALSVPPQWIPRDLTIENYAAFFAPSGTRAIVGSRPPRRRFPAW